MNDRQLRMCLKYAPRLFFDRNEPFPIQYVGCTVFEQSGSSPSFPGSPERRRNISLERKKAAAAIEYAYYFDYDIQHLYELEHIWVYIDQQENVCGCEASFHGKYLNQMISLFPILEPDTTKVQLYSQPGKHAFLPSPELFQLYPEPDDCCMAGAGACGLDVPEMFKDAVPNTEEIQITVRKFMQERYAFKPSWKFQLTDPDESLYIAWEELALKIPNRIVKELVRMGIS